MNPDVRVESLVERLLVESPRSRAPDQLRLDIASATSRRRQRPRWLAILKEPPMRYRSHVAFGSPTARVAALAAVTMLVAILGVAAIVAAQSPAPPADDAAPQMPSVFTGQLTCDRLVRVDGTVPTWRQIATMSDPRIEGDHYHSRQTNTHVGRGPDGPQASTVSWGAQRVENEGGAWQGTMVTFTAPDEPSGTSSGTRETYVLTGEGGYEGLTAIYDIIFKGGDGCVVDVQGVIFEGDLVPIEPFIPE
jgi:hypothetical protein